MVYPSLFLFSLFLCFVLLLSFPEPGPAIAHVGELEQKTMEVASDLEEFEPFDDGNYFALYNQNMKLEQGALPSGFDINAGFESGKLSTYTSSQATYYYFDVYNESEGKWIRGVRLASGLGKRIKYLSSFLGHSSSSVHPWDGLGWTSDPS